MVAFAGTASLGREARDAPEPGHTSVPVQQSPEEAAGMQRGSAAWPGSGGEAGQPREKARECPSNSAQQTLTARTALSHPPRLGKARSALLLRLPRPYRVPVPPPSPQIQLRGLVPPKPHPAAACGKREQGVNENQGAQRGAAVSRQRWEVEGPGSLRTWRCQTSIDSAWHRR